jgi:hypothetical protein
MKNFVQGLSGTFWLVMATDVLGWVAILGGVARSVIKLANWHLGNTPDKNQWHKCIYRWLPQYHAHVGLLLRSKAALCFCFFSPDSQVFIREMDSYQCWRHSSGFSLHLYRPWSRSKNSYHSIPPTSRGCSQSKLACIWSQHNGWSFWLRTQLLQMINDSVDNHIVVAEPLKDASFSLSSNPSAPPNPYARTTILTGYIKHYCFLWPAFSA